MLLFGLILLLLCTAISSKWPFYISKLTLEQLNTNFKDNLSYGLTSNKTIENGPKIINRITIIVLLYSIFLSINVLYYYNMLYNKDSIGIYNGLFLFSHISESFEIFMYLLSIIILSITSYNYSCLDFKGNKIIKEGETLIKWSGGQENRLIKEKDTLTGHLSSTYPILIILNLLGAILFMKNADLVSMYITIELQSFSLYIISSVNRNIQISVKSGLNYFLLGGLSSTFILLGSALIYSSTCLTSLENIYIIHSILNNDLVNNQLWSSMLYIGISILLIGYLFKIGSSPFHNWAPDVYDGVPHVITIWLQVMTKISILIFLLNFIYHLNIYLDTTFIEYNTLFSNNLIGIDNVSNYNLSYNQIYSYVILFSAVLSLIIGSILGLVQYRIKRLLAYSTISHVGFLLVCLYLSGPSQSPSSLESYMFYLIQYSLSSCNNLLIIMAFGYMYYSIKDYINNARPMKPFNGPGASKYNEVINSIIYIDDLKGGFWINPMLSLCFFISLFSLAGIPPQMGFFAKQMVILSTIENGYLILAIIMILMSVISASYYLRIMKIMYFDNQDLEYSKDIVLNNNYTGLSLLISQDEKGGYSDTINNNNKPIPNNNILAWSQLNSNDVNSSEYFSNIISFWISIITLITLLFYLKPIIILNWVHILTISLYYY